MPNAGNLELCVAKTFKNIVFRQNILPVCAISKTYRKSMLVRMGGANYCCGGIENLDLSISAHKPLP